MRSMHLRFLCAWLCLIGLVANTTLLAGTPVLCHDADGGCRVEWSCGGTPAGNEVVACEAAKGDGCHGVLPCEDTPLRSAYASGAVTLRAATVWLASATAVCLAGARPAGLSTGCPRLCALHDARPPDAIGAIRTVILVV